LVTDALIFLGIGTIFLKRLFRLMILIKINNQKRQLFLFHGI